MLGSSLALLEEEEERLVGAKRQAPTELDESCTKNHATTSSTEKRRRIQIQKYYSSYWGLNFLKRFDEMRRNPKGPCAKFMQRRIGVSFVIFDALLEKAIGENLLEPLPGKSILMEEEKQKMRTKLFDDGEDEGKDGTGKRDSASEEVDTPPKNKAREDGPRPPEDLGYDDWLLDDDLQSVNSDESIDDDEDNEEEEYPLVPLELKLMVAVRMICKRTSYRLLAFDTAMSRKCVRRCHAIFLSRFPQNQFLEWVKATRKRFTAPRKPRQKKVVNAGLPVWN
jgi:hypothetical protein